MLISGTLGLPLLPVRGVLALARTIQQQAEQELASPAALRRRLEAVEREYGDESDPLAAQRKAEEMEQVLGAIVQPAPVIPADDGADGGASDEADDGADDGAGDR